MGDSVNPNLKYIQYKGTNQGIKNNTNRWYNDRTVLELITE